MNILFAASEVFPYAKTGGLADVAHSLPLALAKYTAIARVMPLYGFMSLENFLFYDNFTLSLDGENYSVAIYTKKENGVVTYFVKAPYLSQTEHIYGDENGDYKNNALRFGIFCMAIIELGIRLNCKLIHLNDWHTALAALYIKEHELNIKTIFTIHNLAYQGIFDKSLLDVLGIPLKYFTMDALEFYGQINLLKAGIAYSDTITTVSPSYAQEILTEQFGYGLNGFLKIYKEKLTGILNGIDYDAYKPLRDKSLKKKAKFEFYEKFGFKNSNLPLFVMVSRLVAQKGIDLFIESFRQLQSKNINIFILGEGDRKYALTLSKLAKRYENFSFHQGYNESLSHQVYLASDFLLMPSVFEPCGLNQFIAMNYASLPVVHEVGGLKDSIHETTAVCGRGVTYTQQNQKEFIYAVCRAIELYKQKKKMNEIINFNLSCNFSFDKSAKKYLQLYERLL